MSNKEFRPSPAQTAYLRGLLRRERVIRGARWALLIFCLVVWELSTRLGWVDGFLLSSPSRMAKTLFSLVRSGELWLHLGVTLWETLLGFVLGGALGFAVAVALWWSPTLSRILEPYLVVLNSLPKIALGPVLIVWIGSGKEAIVTMALLISVIVTLVTVLTGFSEIDPDKLVLLRSFGASKRQLLTMAVIPGSVPVLMSALKLNISMTWVGVIVGEFLVSRAGLGYLIVYGGQVFKLDLVMTSTIVLCLFAALLYCLVAALEKRVLAKRG